jgi:hypothetical protein
MDGKFKLKLNVKDITEDIEPQLKQAGAATASAAYYRGLELAKSGFGSSGFKNWSKGYKFNKVDDGMYVIAVEGKLANMMEDGINTGEISEMLMKGTRASINKAQGKDYVDVPFHKDADAAGSVSIQGQKFQVQGFKNADEMMKQFSKPQSKSVSFTKGSGIEKENRMISRAKKLQDLIKSEDQKKGSTSYLTIRRVSEDSVWPASPYAGQKVLDKLSLEVEQIFAKMLETFVGRS